MKLEELKYFFEVSECKSFNLAAKNLYISRQSIIRNITNLENELNMPLFSRGYAGVELTDFGAAFYEQSKEAMKVLERLENFTQIYHEKNNQKIILGIRGKFRSAFVIKQIIEKFSEENPEISIETVDASGEDICSAVESGRMDLGFTIFEPNMPENLEKITLTEFRQYFLMNKMHPLATKSVIVPEDLDQQKIIITAYSSVPAMLLQNFINGKAQPKEIIGTVDHGMVYRILEGFEYITMIMERDAKHALEMIEGLAMKPAAPDIILNMGLIHGKDQPLSLQEKLFIQYVKNHFSESL